VRTLLLGSTGFLGGRIHRALLEAGIGVVSGVAREAARFRRGGVDLATATPEEWALLLDHHRPDVIVNAAGITRPGPQLWSVNVTAVTRLLDAVEAAPSHPRLVHLGSAAEYGAIVPGRPVSEAAAVRPVGEYGESKLAATRSIVDAADAGRCDAVVLRVFNPVGPGAAPATLAGRTVDLLRRARADGARVINTGPLRSFRDFVDVDDTARSVVAAADLSRHPVGVINIGSGVATPSRALVQLLVEVSGWRGEVVEEPAECPDPVPWQQAGVERALAELDWRPSTPLGVSGERLWAAAGRAAQPLVHPA
jgi:NDP-hexose 4-ketoreductase